MDAAAPTEESRIELGALADELGFLLRMAQLRLYAVFFDEFGEDGLRPGAYSVLVVVGANPGVRQGVLARRLMIKPAHMTKMVRQFEADGLVERRVPDDDRRAVELRLTAAGTAHVERFAGRFYGHDRDRLAELSPRDRAELGRLLRKLVGMEAAR